MRSVLIVNPKGGAGKTTLATNLAAALANLKGRQDVRLWDLDRQHSALDWLALRPADRPLIRGMNSTQSSVDRNKGAGSGWLILDAPAGIRGKMLDRALKVAHKVIVPIQPSVFDMAASSNFIRELLKEKAVRKQNAFVGIVGMRVDPRTRAAATLEAFLGQFDLPVVTLLRDTQLYANAAFNGLSVFDLPASIGGREVAQWHSLLEWITE
jgi:chromosome partitioning protein